MGFASGTLGCQACLLDTSQCRACVQSDRVTCGTVDEPGRVLGMVPWGKTAALVGLQHEGTARFIRISSSLQTRVEHTIEGAKSTMMTTEGRVFVIRHSYGQAVLIEVTPSSREPRELGKFQEGSTLSQAARTADGRTLLGLSPRMNAVDWISVDRSGEVRTADPLQVEGATYDSTAASRPVSLDPAAFRAPTHGTTSKFLEGYSALVDGGRVWVSSRQDEDESVLLTLERSAVGRNDRSCYEKTDVFSDNRALPTTRIAEVAFVRDGE